MSKPVYIVVTELFPSPGRWKYGYGYDFVKALQATGKYDVRVFMPWFSGGRDYGGALTHDDYEIGGIRVTRFHAKRLPSAIFPLLFSRANGHAFLNAIAGQGVALENVAVCHAHTASYVQYANAIKRRNPRCKTLLHHHDLQSFGLNLGILRHCWLYNMVEFLVLRRAFERIDCHVFISEASRRSFLAAPDTAWTQYADYKKQMRGLPWKPVRIKDSIILHNGVDTKTFRRLDVQTFRRDNGKFVIGCVANFEVLKDQMTLLRAVEQLKQSNNRTIEQFPIRVIFVGSGPELENCRRFAAEKGLEVEFRSEVRHEQLAAFYRGLDLFVLPSYFEGFGCVYAEAYACGVPFIACEKQGVEDLIAAKDRKNWLFRPGDADDLARRIENYIVHRPMQEVQSEICIEPLIERFVKDIEGVRT